MSAFMKSLNCRNCLNVIPVHVESQMLEGKRGKSMEVYFQPPKLQLLGNPTLIHCRGYEHGLRNQKDLDLNAGAA